MPSFLGERRPRVVLVLRFASRLDHAATVSQAAVRRSSVTSRGRAWEHRVMAGRLYVVGTPIGNLGDLSERARETL